MTLKNFELKNKLNQFEELKDLNGFKFVIALSKNKSLIEKEIEILDEIRTESQDIIDIRKQFLDKQRELAKKDKDGNPIITSVQNEDGTPSQKIELTKANEKKLSDFLTKLEKDNQDILKKQKEKDDEFIKALNSDAEIDFVKIKESDVPNEVTLEQFDIISFMVDLD